MENSRRIIFSGLTGYTITVIGILGAGLLIIPEESRSDLFWPRMLWVAFLSLLVWGSLTCFLHGATLGREDRKRVMGILPATQMVLVTYAVLSFLIMIVHSLMPVSDSGSRIHLLFQIGLAVVSGITFVFLTIASVSAAKGLENTFEPGLSPAGLCALLKEQESKISRDSSAKGLEKTIKSLREKIQYSLPAVGKIGSSSTYHGFSEAIRTVCADLVKHNDMEASDVEGYQERFCELIRQVDGISSQTVQR